MKTTLILFSGLPGTGKTTLARFASQKLRIPVLSIDDVVSAIPAHMKAHAKPFWDDMISILLNLVESQLSQSMSVIVDSVFMGEDRYLASKIAQRNQAEFRPIYTYISDEAVWENRVRIRKELAAPEVSAEVASWERLIEQRQQFYPWKSGTALFVDGVHSVEENYNKVMEYITSSN